MKKKSGLKSFKFHINSFPLCEKGILAHDPASPLEEKQKFGNCNITNQSQVRNFEDSNLLENKSEKTIRAAKYDQLLNDCQILLIQAFRSKTTNYPRNTLMNKILCKTTNLMN